MHEIDFDQIDFDTRHGQKMRWELLLQLKDRSGLKYRELAKLSELVGGEISSLGALSRYEKS